MQIEITVIVPAYNAEKTIGFCLDSILRQTPRIEIVVIDDCSTDRTPEILERYRARHENILVIRNEKNIGQGLSRNKGIEVAQGRYLSFVDADDCIDEHMLEDMLSLSENTADIVRCGCQLLDQKSKPLALQTKRFSHVQKYDKDGIMRVALPLVMGRLHGEPLTAPSLWSVCTTLYRTELVRENSVVFFSERKLYSEDLFFNIECLRNASACVTTESEYYFYFIGNKQSTTHRFHDPREKCRRLLALAADNDVCLHRARRSVLNSLSGSACQLVSDKTIPWKKKVHIMKELGVNPLFAECRDAIPARQFTRRRRVFFVFALHGFARASLLLTCLSMQINRLRDRQKGEAMSAVPSSEKTLS